MFIYRVSPVWLLKVKYFKFKNKERKTMSNLKENEDSRAIGERLQAFRF
jgi:hypothetical protein